MDNRENLDPAFANSIGKEVRSAGYNKFPG
jgi:hypothetical protein